MYKQFFSPTSKKVESVIRTTDGACIPFDPANTDYANFKKEVSAGAELQDAEGQSMSVADAKAYVAALP